MRYIVNKTSVASVQLGKPLDLKLSFVSPPRQGIGFTVVDGVVAPPLYAQSQNLK